MCKNPIIIAAPPRSGTTMVSGLLYQHGVWIGEAKRTDFPGTNPDFGAENMRIKSIMKQYAKRIGYKNWSIPLPDQGDVEQFPEMKKAIDRVVPDEKVWLINTSWTLVFSNFWNWAFPDAKWVLLYRHEDKIVDSMNRHPSMKKHPDNKKRAFVEALKERQINIDTNLYTKSIYINSEKIAEKDTIALTKLFSFLNIEPDLTKVEQWIQEDRMSK